MTFHWNLDQNWGFIRSFSFHSKFPEGLLCLKVSIFVHFLLFTVFFLFLFTNLLIYSAGRQTSDKNEKELSDTFSSFHVSDEKSITC